MIKYDVADYKLIYIYAINDESHKGLLKVGEHSFSSNYSIAQLEPNCATLNHNALIRIREQTRTALNDYQLLYTELAIKTIVVSDGSRQSKCFGDKDVHDVLYNSGYSSVKFKESGRNSEWFKVDLETVIKAIKAVKDGETKLRATNSTVKTTKKGQIVLRFEQEENVNKTIRMFKKYDDMLWNCKMRYGKTVTAYELIKRQGYQKVIVITHRPAVEDGWSKDHNLIFDSGEHLFIDKTKGSVDYDGAIDAENDRMLLATIDSGDSFVYFASIQDLRGSQRVGGKFNKNNVVFDTDWDLVIVDEAHEGTMTILGDAVIKGIRKNNTKVLWLSGTPYNMINDFGENQYTWTYVDEQKAKAQWAIDHPDECNPYDELPQMNIYTFDLTEEIPKSYLFVNEEWAFSFREFFRTWTGNIDIDYRQMPSDKSIGDFVYEEEVYKFLSLITDEIPNSNYPFSSEEYRNMFAHTFWLVPGVKEAKALSALIKRHPKFKEYKVVNVAGDGDDDTINCEELNLVRSAIASFPKTITISCDRLTTGVTVPEWTAIMMLCGSVKTAASRYMQAIFRVQSPGCVNGKQKKNCYVFDFAPDRTLSVVAQVHNLSGKESRRSARKNDEKDRKALGEFINFCPIISIKGTTMRSYDVDEMMRQIKSITVETAINSGFEDDTIYLSNAGMILNEFDAEIIRKLTDVLNPQKKGKKQSGVVVNYNGLTEEQYELAEKARHKPKKELTEAEKEAEKLENEQKEEQSKLFNLLRAVSIRLPLLFYGADADITKIIHLKDFVNTVDPESWDEFMPKGLSKKLFEDILRFYDEDIVVGAGLRIRKMAKAADELMPTYRAKRLIEIISKFKNPDKETVLTPWRVVNMHMGNTLGGYNFYDNEYRQELEEPRLVDNGDVTADVFLDPDSKVLEMNSKSGLYPLYLAYTFYMLNVSGKERDLTLEQAQKIWFDTLDKHIFVLCRTKMARMITIRTLVGYMDKPVHAICLTKLVEERMKDLDRLSNKLTNPDTWGIEGGRMKFEAVVGNPPYQLEGGSGGSNDAPIYHTFAMLANQVNPNYSSLIMPARWFSAGRENLLGAFRHFMLTNRSLQKLVAFTDSSLLFSPVEIKGGICYYLLNSKYNGDCNYSIVRNNIIQTMNRNLSRFDILIRDPMLSTIVETVMPLTVNGETVDTIISNDTPFGISSNPRSSKKSPLSVFTNATAEHDVFLYHIENNKRKIEYVRRCDISKNEDDIDTYKVFIPGSGGSGDDDIVLGKPEYAPPHSVCSQSFLYAKFSSENEAKNFISYLKTKFFRALVAAVKISQAAPNKVYRFVPLQDFSVQWTDKILYKKYLLSESQINYIETMYRKFE